MVSFCSSLACLEAKAICSCWSESTTLRNSNSSASKASRDLDLAAIAATECTASCSMAPTRSEPLDQRRATIFPANSTALAETDAPNTALRAFFLPEISAEGSERMLRSCLDPDMAELITNISSANLRSASTSSGVRISLAAFSACLVELDMMLTCLPFRNFLDLSRNRQQPWRQLRCLSSSG